MSGKRYTEEFKIEAVKPVAGAGYSYPGWPKLVDYQRIDTLTPPPLLSTQGTS